MHPNVVIDYLPVARKAFVFPPLALASVTSRDGTSVYASADKLFKGAIFGRDSLEVAEDLLPYKPRLARNILLKLGSLQGTTTNPINEEESGKIIHEYRTSRFNGRPLDKTSMEIFKKLGAKWGGNDNELAYYGSADVTPHYLRALGSYCLLYGDNILEERVRRRDGSEVSVREVARHCLEWLNVKLESPSGLVEFQRTNPHGLLNQVWKDSDEYYVHENGEDANHQAPIASIEVQGLAYDAWLAAARFFPEKKAEHLAKAERLRDRVISLLWQADKGYFALGTDYDSSGNLRVIQTKTASPAALLDTNFFDALPLAEQEKYITAITTTVMSPDFLTNAGIRSRALSASGVVPLWDYHGSFVTWPKETYDIAKGLRRHGMPDLSRQLENRLLNVIFRTLEYPEFIYVDEWGRALTGAPSKHTHGEIILVEGRDTPERTQAWTVSAIYAIMLSRLRAKAKIKIPKANKPSHRQDWQIVLEHNLLSRIPRMNRLINPLQLASRYPAYKYALTKQKRQESK